MRNIWTFQQQKSSLRVMIQEQLKSAQEQQQFSAKMKENITSSLEFQKNLHLGLDNIKTPLSTTCFDKINFAKKKCEF